MIDGGKRGLRRAARQARRALSSDARRAADATICARLEALAAEVGARTVAAYAPVGAEVDPSAFARAALSRGVVVAYPRVVGPGRMVLAAVTDLAELTPGFKGIPEPPPERPPLPLSALDLVVVPGVAFDAARRRLGQGMGFYDRLLAAPDRRALAVGVAYDVQVVEAVPAEPHDVAVDVLVTDRAVLR